MTYSQYHEDDLVDDLLDRPAVGVIVDIGAGDGMEISNSRLFRERGWWVVLVESDPRYQKALAALAATQVSVLLLPAIPENINELVPDDTTILSIDVDGDDIFLLEALERYPEVIVVEHNPTMPYSMDVQPIEQGLRIGSSVAALARIARGKGYGLQAVTHCNAIFRLGAEDVPMPEYRPGWFVATEYFSGEPLALGEYPWGVRFHQPYPRENVIIR